MNLIRLMTVIAAGSLAAAAAAEMRSDFTMPRVDLMSSAVGSQTGMAVWSSTPRYITPGAVARVVFPPFTVVPASFPSDTIFMKYTQADGNFSLSEVTVTAWADPSQRMVSWSLPAMWSGPFYLRFHRDFGLVNPDKPGKVVLSLGVPAPDTTPVMPENVTVCSKPYTIGGVGDLQSQGTLKGVVYDQADNTVPGIPLLIQAVSNTGAPLSLPDTMLSPTLNAGNSSPRIDSLAATNNAFMAVTRLDGTYEAVVPTLAPGQVFRMTVKGKAIASTPVINGSAAGVVDSGDVITQQLQPGQTQVMNLKLTTKD